MKLLTSCEYGKSNSKARKYHIQKSMNYEVDYQLNDFINMIDKHLKLIRSTKQKKRVGFVKILSLYFL